MGRALLAQEAFLTPASNFEITSAAAGAMAVFVGGTIHAKQSVSKVCRAAITYLGAGLAGSAFFTPALRNIVAGVALGAVRTFFCGTIRTYFATFRVGTTVTDLGTCAVGTFSAFEAQLHTLIARKALTAIG